MSDITEYRWHAAGDETCQKLTHMFLNVGIALSEWSRTEDILRNSYCALVVEKGTTADGAIASFDVILTTKEKINAIKNVFNRVLYHNKIDSHRSEVNRLCSALTNAAEKRNKIAHGCVYCEGEHAKNPVFIPYYSTPLMILHEEITKTGSAPSTLKRIERLQPNQLHSLCMSVRDARAVATKLFDLIARVLEDNAELLAQTTRLRSRTGLPRSQYQEPRDDT